MRYEAVIGLEVHAELETRSKMFCACPVVDVTQAEPNLAVCPICAGMPGTLPVVNQRAVEFAMRVALALNCEIAPTSFFARKNYFYPDLPKGYQISQYDAPLARHGRLPIQTSSGERSIRIRRVHLEEDTGKLTHMPGTEEMGGGYSLVDLNRAGIPLLEIVTEPDFRTSEEVRAYATGLRALLRYLGVNSGDMQKGVLRIEPNVSIRPRGQSELGERVEIKNLNSFRALERSVEYEIQRQAALLDAGKSVRQETVGWDVEREVTFTQRVKEAEQDYRYFPEPDLPPLVIEAEWIEQVRRALPELPYERLRRFKEQYGLSDAAAGTLVAEQAAADYFEQALQAAPQAPPSTVANWISGELFALMHQSGASMREVRVSPQALAELVQMVLNKTINKNTARSVLVQMSETGRSAGQVVNEGGLHQISDQTRLTEMVAQVLRENPQQVQAYLAGKDGLVHWLFGQVMRAAQGQANTQSLQAELERQLAELRKAAGK